MINDILNSGAATKENITKWVKEVAPEIEKVGIYVHRLNGVEKPGAIFIYVGALTGGIDNATVTKIHNYILPKMPICSNLYVSSASTRPVAYSGVITIESAFNNAATKAAIRDNIALYSRNLQVNETVFKRKIEIQILKIEGVVDFEILTEDTPIRFDEIGYLVEDPTNSLVFKVI